MKFYSEETGKLYDTEEECAEAIERYYKQQEICRRTQENLKKTRENKEKALEAKREHVETELKEFYEMIKEYNNLYKTQYICTIKVPSCIDFSGFWF